MQLKHLKEVRMQNNFLELFSKSDEKNRQTALTHSSYAHEKGIESNERLEFLGDAVLQIAVSDYLFKHYHKDEGRMTKIRSAFVCTENLASKAKEIDIAKSIKFGKSFKGKTISNSILANTIESMIAVIYLTFGMQKTQKAVINFLDVEHTLKVGIEVKNYKSYLQEYCQNLKQKVKYESVMVDTADGQKTFRASVFVDGKFVAFGQGSTKKLAEQNSAKLAIKKLTNQN